MDLRVDPNTSTKVPPPLKGHEYRMTYEVEPIHKLDTWQRTGSRDRGLVCLVFFYMVLSRKDMILKVDIV